jgi:hypothetical protein
MHSRINPHRSTTPYCRGKLLAIREMLPGAHAKPEALTALGTTLREWQATRPHARYIWGLDDLLQGRAPRTPPIYLAVPYSSERFEEQFEQVALAFVAAGTERKDAAEDLARHLQPHFEVLYCLEDPETFSYRRR